MVSAAVADAVENIVQAIRYTIASYTPMGPRTEQETMEWEAHLQIVQARKDAMEVLGLTPENLEMIEDMKNGDPMSTQDW